MDLLGGTRTFSPRPSGSDAELDSETPGCASVLRTGWDMLPKGSCVCRVRNHTSQAALLSVPTERQRVLCWLRNQKPHVHTSGPVTEVNIVPEAQHVCSEPHRTPRMGLLSEHCTSYLTDPRST